MHNALGQVPLQDHAICHIIANPLFNLGDGLANKPFIRLTLWDKDCLMSEDFVHVWHKQPHPKMPRVIRQRAEFAVFLRL